jgi:hypothetical protein
MTRPLSWLLCSLFTLGCGKPIRKPAPVPNHLQAGDFRQAYLGEWHIEFALDSTRDPAVRPEAWTPAADTSAQVAGKLQVQDSLLGPDHRALAAIYEIDFGPLLGRPMSCLVPGASGLQVAEKDGRVSLWFTPGAFDCGFSGWAPLGDDTLTGAWEETSIGGPVARGRFWIWRQ